MRNPFKNRSELHVIRKVSHFLGVLFIIYWYNELEHLEALKIISLITFIIISFEFLRLYSKPVNRITSKMLAPVLRKTEIKAFSGLSAMALGCTIAIFLFPKPIVILSLFFLATADPIAGYFGVKYGKDKLLTNKTLQGTAAAFFCCTIVSLIFYSTNDLMTDRLFIVSLLSGFAGALSELAAFGKLDDNFTIPVLGSSFLWVLFKIFGGL